MASKVETPAGEDRGTTEAVVAGGGFESSRPPCRFFLLGKCKFGDSCSFSHQPRGRLPVCRFFEKTGSCRYGQSCKFLHGASAGGTPNTPAHATAEEGAAAPASSGAPAAATTPAAACASSAACAAACAAGATGAAAAGAECGEGEHMLDAGDNCGICLENIPSSGKRFGLLNCDHVYCLECLRTWRKSKGPQKDISRTCPECRKVSFFLVPSKEHLKGKAKLKAIQAYKKGLSKLPCKYHKSDNSNVCPFGARCFYAHLDASGADVKDRPTPPPPQGAPRRSCPYLRVGGARGGARSGGGGSGGGGGGHRGVGHGGGREGFDNLRHLYAFDFEANMYESQERHMNAIIRLQQLMIDAEHF